MNNAALSSIDLIQVEIKTSHAQNGQPNLQEVSILLPLSSRENPLDSFVVSIANSFKYPE